jgi:glycosyltransferase involved in cell wall biosynthesis
MENKKYISYGINDIEILISTMNRKSLDFLHIMFKNNDLSRYTVLIINQTTEDCLLTSDSKNIRIINTEETGLPQSRNMAIKNAKNKICLVADDDVVYTTGFEQKIISAHEKFNDATVITFKMLNEDGENYQDYLDFSFQHTHKSIVKVNGVVISFDLKRLKNQNISYNNHFGIGSTFECANENVFMKNVLKARAKAYFVPKIILTHPNYSTGIFGEHDKVIKARSAFQYKYYGWLAYIWVFKYIRFLYVNDRISFNEIRPKTKLGFSGIAAYRKLLKSGLEKRN